MRVGPLVGTAALAALIGPASPAAGQQEGTCRPFLERAGVMRSEAGGVRSFWSGGVWARCLGQATRMYADSVAWFGDLDRMDFVGNVRFRDSTVSLDARRAAYFPGDERIEAYRDVRLVNRLTGSVLTGPRLTYLREAAGLRDASELMAAERPRVEYRAPGDTAAEAYVIVGNRVRLRGESLAWAAGAVTITRSTIDARADSAQLDVAAGVGALIGTAEARGPGQDTAGYRIRGRRIDFLLSEGSLTWVQAGREAEAHSAGWEVVGDTIEFVLADDLIQSGSAWGDSTTTRAMSETQTIEADSLAIDTPDQVLTEVRGFRGARAVSRDTLGRAEDWMVGDTIVARFDSTADGGRRLARLEARGNARAFYHVYDPAAPDAPPAINYARGRVITARFREDGQLDRVDVVDAADGVYLEPLVGRRP